jgi:LPXTG-motif cell wall-anchored protein
MSLPQRFPNVPRITIAVMSMLLASVVGMTFATAQSSEPVSTGQLTVDIDGVLETGDEVDVSGAGFAPGTKVDVTIESDPVLIDTVTTDAAGAFAMTATIPSSIPSGAHTLKATGADPLGGLRILSMAVTVSADPSNDLPRTGVEISQLVAAGVIAVLLGAALLRMRRRLA